MAGKKTKATLVLAPGAFPVTLELLHWKTREVLWSVVIKNPAPFDFARVPIPGRDELGAPVIAKMTYGDGSVFEGGPPIVS